MPPISSHSGCSSSRCTQTSEVPEKTSTSLPSHSNKVRYQPGCSSHCLWHALIFRTGNSQVGRDNYYPSNTDKSSLHKQDNFCMWWLWPPLQTVQCSTRPGRSLWSSSSVSTGTVCMLQDDGSFIILLIRNSNFDSLSFPDSSKRKMPLHLAFDEWGKIHILSYNKSKSSPCSANSVLSWKCVTRPAASLLLTTKNWHASSYNSCGGATEIQEHSIFLKFHKLWCGTL